MELDVMSAFPTSIGRMRIPDADAMNQGLGALILAEEAEYPSLGRSKYRRLALAYSHCCLLQCTCGGTRREPAQHRRRRCPQPDQNPFGSAYSPERDWPDRGSGGLEKPC